MTGLEELNLRLYVSQRSTSIDSTYLNRQIIAHLPHLRTFNFDILTYTSSLSEVLEQSTEESQHLSYNGRFHPLVYYTDRLEHQSVRSHIFSLPFVFDRMESITSQFPGGLFANVRHLVLSDLQRPFEHEFFLRMTACFPLLTRLTVVNFQPQEKKRTQPSNETEPIASLVEFNHLKDLVFIAGHEDYAEQLLVDTNTRLPRLTALTIDYEQLFIVTENFTRHATRRNCINIDRLRLTKLIAYSKEMSLYFPSCR